MWIVLIRENVTAGVSGRKDKGTEKRLEMMWCQHGCHSCKEQEVYNAVRTTELHTVTTETIDITLKKMRKKKKTKTKAKTEKQDTQERDKKKEKKDKKKKEKRKNKKKRREKRKKRPQRGTPLRALFPFFSPFFFSFFLSFLLFFFFLFPCFSLFFFDSAFSVFFFLLCFLYLFPDFFEPSRLMSAQRGFLSEAGSHKPVGAKATGAEAPQLEFEATMLLPAWVMSSVVRGFLGGEEKNEVERSRRTLPRP